MNAKCRTICLLSIIISITYKKSYLNYQENALLRDTFQKVHRALFVSVGNKVEEIEI